MDGDRKVWRPGQKPRLTPQECRWLDEVHQDIIRYDRRHNLDQAFCDRHDGNLYENEVRPLIRIGLLIKLPMERCDRRPGPLLGCRWSAVFTEDAVRHFWPARAKEIANAP